jgi:hypothetical protein
VPELNPQPLPPARIASGAQPRISRPTCSHGGAGTTHSRGAELMDALRIAERVDLAPSSAQTSELIFIIKFRCGRSESPQ